VAAGMVLNKAQHRVDQNQSKDLTPDRELADASISSGRSSLAMARQELASHTVVSNDRTNASVPLPSGIDMSDRRIQGMLRQIEHSPHRDQLKKMEAQLHQVQSPEEAAKIITGMRALLTGATGDKSLKEFRKDGMEKLLKELEEATKEVEASYGFSITRPSTLVPFVRTDAQSEAVQAWCKACDKLHKYIKDNVGQLNPDSYSAAIHLASEAVMNGSRKISDLTDAEKNMAQSGMAVSGIGLAASGTILAGYLAFQAARTKNPHFIAAAAGFAAMNLEHDRFIKDLAVTSKSWDEYKKRYADGFEDAAKRAAMTGLVVGVATWAILSLKQGAIPINSLNPSMLSKHCAALALSLEATFGAKLAQDVLVNLSDGICSLVQGIATGDGDKQRAGWKALGDAGIDTAQLGYLGKLIEGWKPAAPAPIPGKPTKVQPEKPTEPEPKRDPEPPPSKPPETKPQHSGLEPDGVFNRTPAAQRSGAQSWEVGNNRRYIGFRGEPTPAEVKKVLDIAEAPIRGDHGKPEKLLDVMGGPQSGFKDSYNIDLRFDPASGKAGVRGDVVKEVGKIPDGSLETVVINNPRTENLELTKEMVAMLLKKLKPGGRIIVSGQVSKNNECNLNNFLDVVGQHPDISVVQNGTRANPELHPDIKRRVDNGELQFATTDGRPITSGLGSFTIVKRPE